MDDGGDYLMSFADFLYAFQLQFYYQGKRCPFYHNVYILLHVAVYSLQAVHFHCMVI